TSTGATSGAAGQAFAALESVVQSKCASCHNGSIAPSDYTSETGFDADASGISQRLSGQGAPMPPQGPAPLTDTEKQALLAYVGALTGATAAPTSSSSPCASSGGSIGTPGGTTDPTIGGTTDPTGGTAGTGNMGDPGQTTATTVSNSTLLQQTLQ